MSKERKERINLTLTTQQTKNLDAYRLELHKKTGKLPRDINAKLARMALDEWFKKHQNDFNIKWDSKK